MHLRPSFTFTVHLLPWDDAELTNRVRKGKHWLETSYLPVYIELVGPCVTRRIVR
jgi:hypothetical protein